MGKKKKKEKIEEEDTYDLRGTHNVLSNILKTQMEKNLFSTTQLFMFTSRAKEVKRFLIS